PAGLELAAKRCREYALGDAPPATRPFLEAMADYFLSVIPRHRPELLPVLNEFSNDLDASRGQSFAETLPDLFAVIRESGYVWHNRCRHADLLQINVRRRAS